MKKTFAMFAALMTAFAATQSPAATAVGALPTPTRGGYAFDGWFTAASGGSKVSASTKVTANVTYYAHWRNSDAAAYVTVRTKPGQEALGKVTGGNGSVKAGQKVAVRASANKGAAFAGWLLNGELVARTPSYVYVATGDAATLEAEFIAAADDHIHVEGVDIELDVREQVYGDVSEFFEVGSASAATVRITGLPAGVKFDSASGTISGAPTRAGVYYVTCAVANGNGYKQSATAVWTIGDAGNGDYDNIGLESWLGGRLEQLENLSTGDEIDICTNLKSVSGFPAGLKFKAGSHCSDGWCTECSGFLFGTVTKAGKYTMTFTDYENRKAVKTVVVRDAGSRYVSVSSPLPSRGTATGSGVYAVGSNAKLSAKPAKGYYFAGWYEDADFEEPFYGTASGSYQKSSDQMVVRGENPAVYAKFITQSEDYVIFDASDRWEVDGSSSWAEDYEFYVYGETAVKVTVSGMPAGMKFVQDGEYCRIKCQDLKKLKPGTSDVKFTARTATGATATHTLRIVVPNLQSWVFDGLEYSDTAYNLTLGVSDACVDGWVSSEYDRNYRITASGLPAGLKLVAYDGYMQLVGTPTKAGTYTVTFTAKSGRDTQIATITVSVAPLPDAAIGTFNGFLANEWGEIVASVTMTAAANGRLSAKVVSESGTINYSASSWSCEGDGWLLAYFTKEVRGEDATLMLELDCTKAWNDVHQMTGYGPGGEIVYMQRSPFGRNGVQEANAWAKSWKGTYGLVEDVDEDYNNILRDPAYHGEDTFKLLVSDTGMARLTGKTDFGASISTSSTIMFDEEGPFVIFLAPVRQKVCAHSTVSEKCFFETVFYCYTYRW